MDIPKVTFINKCPEESPVNLTVEVSPIISPRLVASTSNEVMNQARSSCSEPCLSPLRELIPDYMSNLALPSPAYPATHSRSRGEHMNAPHEALNSQLAVPDPALVSRVHGDTEESQSQEHVLSPVTLLWRLQTTDLEPDEETPTLELPSQAHTAACLIPKQGGDNSTSLRDTWSSYSPPRNTSSSTSSPPGSFLIERGYDEMEDSAFIPESMMKGQILPPPPSTPLLSGSYSLLGSSRLEGPRELPRTPSPALTPYPSLESSATTLEFGFAPMLNHMPEAHHVETHPSPPESEVPTFENWRDVPMTCRSQSPSEILGRNPCAYEEEAVQTGLISSLETC